MKLVCLADTHGYHRRLTVPAGDVLIFAGDFTSVNSDVELFDFNDWLGDLPHSYKLFVAGNHDWCFETHLAASQKALTNAIYLQDSYHIIGGVKFYGSPWQPRFYDWAFNLERGKALKEKWDMIPSDVDVLVTHSPPVDQRDLNSRGLRTGCQDLAEAVERVMPKVHIFGHIHEGYGITSGVNTAYVNASICTILYTPTNSPIVFDLE